MSVALQITSLASNTLKNLITVATLLFVLVAWTSVVSIGHASAGTETDDSNPCVSVFKEALARKIGISSSASFAADLRNYLLNETFRSDLRNGKWGAALSIPVNGVPVSLGFNHSRKHYEEFRQKVVSWNVSTVRWEFYQLLSGSLPDS